MALNLFKKFHKPDFIHLLNNIPFTDTNSWEFIFKNFIRNLPTKDFMADNLLDTLKELKKKGYNIDFNLAFDHIKCQETGECLSPAEFEIVEHFRFEGMSNPDDSSVVYAIESKDGKKKGVLVSAYSIYSSPIDENLLRKLSVRS